MHMYIIHCHTVSAAGQALVWCINHPTCTNAKHAGCMNQEDAPSGCLLQVKFLMAFQFDSYQRVTHRYAYTLAIKHRTFLRVNVLV